MIGNKKAIYESAIHCDVFEVEEVRPSRVIQFPGHRPMDRINPVSHVIFWNEENKVSHLMIFLP
jgi:hypothetical protein